MLSIWPTIWSLLRATIGLQLENYCSTDPLRVYLVYAVSDRLNIRDLLAGEATNIGLVPKKTSFNSLDLASILQNGLDRLDFQLGSVMSVLSYLGSL